MVISGYEYEEERLSKLVSMGLVKFTDEQIYFVKSLGLDFNYKNLSVDNIMKIEETVSNKLAQSGYE